METKFSLEEVFNAYFQCRKNKRNTCNALLFEQNYISNCTQLHKELTDGTYQIGRSIAFVVLKPKPREVFAADFRDRIVHHLVINKLEPLFEKYFINDCYNCRKGKGVLYGVKRMHQQIKKCSSSYTRDCYILKCDMQGFFMSIHKPTLWKMLKKFINKFYKENNKNQLLWLVKMIVMNHPEKKCTIKGDQKLWNKLPANKSLFTCGDDYGLPIGNLTSQMFANFYLTGFDHWIKKYFIYYGRYVDDFYIIDSNKQRLLKSLNYIKHKLSKLQVTLHPNKIYLQHYSKGVKFTGAVNKMSRIYVGNRTIKNMKQMIQEMNQMYPKDVDQFISRINSYLGFLIHYKSYGLRRQILNLIDNSWWKYCYPFNNFKVIKKRHGKKF